MIAPVPKSSGCVRGFAKERRCFGRAGMPQAWVDRLYADYQRLGSLEKVAAAHGRTRQSVYQVFKRAGVVLQPRPEAKPVVRYGGRKYSQDTNGYWRDTVYRSRRAKEGVGLLHHVVWIERHGPIPDGHKVIFKDGNKDHWQLGNLELLSNSAQVRRHATGHNQFTRSAAARTSTLLQNFNRGRRTVAAQLRNRS